MICTTDIERKLLVSITKKFERNPQLKVTNITSVKLRKSFIRFRNRRVAPVVFE